MENFILIADDDADDRYLLETAFKEKGFSQGIRFVENGLDLLNFLKKGETESPKQGYPLFILLDLNMPKKDGREVLKELKQDPLFKRIPVIVFTTTKNENEISRCYDLGANSYIVKPVSFDSLLKIVDNITNYWISTASTPS